MPTRDTERSQPVNGLDLKRDYGIEDLSARFTSMVITSILVFIYTRNRREDDFTIGHKKKTRHFSCLFPEPERKEKKTASAERLEIVINA
jgi:hypothetical protein